MRKEREGGTIGNVVCFIWIAIISGGYSPVSNNAMHQRQIQKSAAGKTLVNTAEHFSPGCVMHTACQTGIWFFMQRRQPDHRPNSVCHPLKKKKTLW